MPISLQDASYNFITEINQQLYYMRKLFTTILSLIMVSLAIQAQSVKEEIYQNINRAGGGYLAYPVKTSLNTPPPSGYEPFYISHYGRHGSRYLISDKDYIQTHELLVKAEKAGALTELGKSVKLRFDTIAPMCKGHGGDLSAVGVGQQKAIAARMFKAFPQVFKGNVEISARATLSPRCILSMDAFCESLKELNSNLDITRESSERYLYYLNYHSPESNAFTSDKGPWREEFRKFQNRHTHPDRLMTSLFSDKDFVEKEVHPDDLMWALYWVAVDMQDIPTNISFYDLFTPDELYELWQVPNLRYYIKDGNYTPSHGMLLDNASALLNNIVVSADEAIKSEKTSATLRFGHDGNLIPLVGLMGLDGCYQSISDMEKVKDIFCDFKISPMAANMQMIFFRNKKNHDDVIVKFMLNEREIGIPIPTPSFPFYKWDDVKTYFNGLIKNGSSSRNNTL